MSRVCSHYHHIQVSVRKVLVRDIVARGFLKGVCNMGIILLLGKIAHLDPEVTNTKNLFMMPPILGSDTTHNRLWKSSIRLYFRLSKAPQLS
jgi:hypothetical protein